MEREVVHVQRIVVSAPEQFPWLHPDECINASGTYFAPGWKVR